MSNINKVKALVRYANKQTGVTPLVYLTSLADAAISGFTSSNGRISKTESDGNIVEYQFDPKSDVDPLVIIEAALQIVQDGSIISPIRGADFSQMEH